MKFDLIRPCVNCPFRSDKPGFLNAWRAEEIIDGITNRQQTFSCHKTNTFEDSDDGCEVIETADSQHCAGAMIFLEKLGQPNQMMRIAERLRMYDHTKLDMASPVFETAEDMIDAQPE